MSINEASGPVETAPLVAVAAIMRTTAAILSHPT